MKETEYAYGVSRIRVHENGLLTGADLEQMISADSYEDVVRLLEDQGWDASRYGKDTAAILEKQSRETWSLLEEAMPDIHELDCLIVPNDFQNVKGAIKAKFSGLEIDGYYTEPSAVSPESLKTMANDKKFDVLPAYLQEPAAKAFDAILRHTGGQNADMILDAAALDTAYDKSADTKCGLLLRLAVLACDTANIKTAYRCAKLKKEKGFMERALCNRGQLDRTGLIQAALSGTDKLFEFLSGGLYSDAAAALKASTTAFEKWCDDIKMKEISSAKYKAFGIEPFAAYYLAKEAEIKNIRVILNAKLNRLPTEVIRMRVRELYV